VSAIGIDRRQVLSHRSIFHGQRWQYHRSLVGLCRLPHLVTLLRLADLIGKFLDRPKVGGSRARQCRTAPRRQTGSTLVARVQRGQRLGQLRVKGRMMINGSVSTTS
jgi:hypothetical protein